jgi:peptide/nickel transport system ATP-binding protein
MNRKNKSEKEKKSSLLEIADLSISFSMYANTFQKKDLTIVRHLSLNARAGEMIAIVGSSGSGKSLLAHAILGILPGNARLEGSISYKGAPLTEERLAGLRGKEIAFIPQSVDFLDPLMRVGKQIAGAKGSKEKMRASLQQFGLNPSVERMVPHQLSGGMARRVLIASAVQGNPVLVVADEPTPGLSELLAREVMDHLRGLADAGAAVLLITHDLELAIDYADRVAVLYAGAFCEIAAASDFAGDLKGLRHPYTKALTTALPRNGFVPIDGSQPYAGSLTCGCAFSSRCQWKTFDCEGSIGMRELREGKVRCIHAT